ncbi:LamG domain-containing protein [Sandaracinus amylolyticus]|uniref:LamG domain-containing protein n=1 Tax=Sandaracinus amylolyticus TaxID=927083 RepID=UPI001470652F|nr:LamG domain-containing protein [Sandaracinus amylolyticus]
MREHVVAVALSGLCAIHAGCGLERVGIVPYGSPRDGGARVDASAPVDAGGGASTDAGVNGVDAGPPDAGRGPACGDDPALVACYPFDGDALDHGPRANDLAVSGVSWDPSGGMALGVTSSAVVATRPELAHAETTVLAWLRVDAMPAVGRAGIVDHDGQYGLFVHPGGELRCAITIAGSGWAMAAAVIEAGRWHHVACVVEDATLRLYVDGREVATAPASTSRAPGSSALYVGENGPTGDDQLIGAIDDLQIWDKPLTGQEIAAVVRDGR